MRVLVTGATGFIGAHSARALLDAGHSVRVLVRDPARVPTTLGALGVTDVEVAPGDMTDPGAVSDAVDGCDAVLHAAAVVSLSRKRVDEIMALNPRGAQVVLDAASAARLDPIVVVSSATALFAPGVTTIHTDLPPADAAPGYGRSKAEVERIARRFQSDGAPVTIVYPTGVIGPPVGDNFGEGATGVETHLRLGYLPIPAARAAHVDVRDLAGVHAALMTPGLGPRRYAVAGHTTTMVELGALYREITGRRFPVVPCPGAVMRGLGRLNDSLSRVLPIDTPITTEAMEIFTRWPDVDDRATRADLGIDYRPLADTLRDTIRALHRADRVSARHAGRLAT